MRWHIIRDGYYLTLLFSYSFLYKRIEILLFFSTPLNNQKLKICNFIFLHLLLYLNSCFKGVRFKYLRRWQISSFYIRVHKHGSTHKRGLNQTTNHLEEVVVIHGILFKFCIPDGNQRERGAIIENWRHISWIIWQY